MSKKRIGEESLRFNELKKYQQNLRTQTSFYSLFINALAVEFCNIFELSKPIEAIRTLKIISHHHWTWRV